VVGEATTMKEFTTSPDIVSYFHCWDCEEEIRDNKNVSAAEYTRFEIGLTKPPGTPMDQQTIQIWCRRHAKPVAILKFMEIPE
jgi:hypothetical protein